MNKLKLIYHFLKTIIFYKPFTLCMGSKVIIYNPILISCKYLRFGNKIFIRDFSRIEGIASYDGVPYSPIIEIQDGVTIEQNLHLTSAINVVIMKNTAIAANVTISDINHQYVDITKAPDKQAIDVAAVVIGEDCKIYNNAVILPGTKLGKHCIVGANTVVTGKSYDDYSVIVGSPSRVVKRYSVEKREWLKTDKNGNFIN
jgi:acetyltransferase-like isoleucine patch superfamily enzyme